jgi:hypothetical protein
MTISLKKLGFLLLTATCLHTASYGQFEVDDQQKDPSGTTIKITIKSAVKEEERFAWLLEYLDDVKQEFNTLDDKDAKQALVTRRIDKDKLWEANSFNELDIPALYLPEKPTYKELQNSTHALALAIWAGDAPLVKSFLSVIDDVNAESLRIWGYRQWYTMGHLAADPQFPAHPLQRVKNEAWLEIMDLLAAKGADFKIVYDGIYANPTTAAGQPSGRELPEADARRARLLLHGADPTFVGTSYSPLYRTGETQANNWRMDKIASLAVDQLKKLHSKSVTVNPTPETKEQINAEIENQISILTAIKL